MQIAVKRCIRSAKQTDVSGVVGTVYGVDSKQLSICCVIHNCVCEHSTNDVGQGELDGNVGLDIMEVQWDLFLRKCRG